MTGYVKRMLIVTTLLGFGLPAGAGAGRGGTPLSGDPLAILPLWEQAKFMERQLKWRQDHIVPEVMGRDGVALWIVGRKEGVLYLSLVPGDKEGLVAEDPQTLVFHISPGGRTAERTYASADELAGIVRAFDPARIAADARDIPRLREAFGSPYGGRLLDSRDLRTGFLEARSPEEISVFAHVVRVAHAVIAEAFSNRAVIPDVTTTDELNWWIRERYRDLGLPTSDHPTITVQRSRAERARYAESDEHFRIDIPPRNGYDTVIRRGDIIACDTGIDYLGLGTDTQQVAYVLKPGESDVPAGLRTALARSNRLQDIFASEFREGRRGNEIWLSALRRAKAEGLRPSIYSHPIPYFLMRYEENGALCRDTRYKAGPDLGDDVSEDPTPEGEYPVHRDTVYAMELDTRTAVPEWGGQDVRITLEQTVAFTADGILFLGGRQTEWHVIR